MGIRDTEEFGINSANRTGPPQFRGKAVAVTSVSESSWAGQDLLKVLSQGSAGSVVGPGGVLAEEGGVDTCRPPPCSRWLLHAWAGPGSFTDSS